MNNKPTTILHYTDIKSVRSILFNQKLWLTDIRFLNDSEELKEGLNYLLERLNNPAFNILQKEYKKESVEYLKRKLDEFRTYGEDGHSVFVFSLGGEDLLSQWRAYGNYAIEFDETRLKSKAVPISECIYDEKSKAKKAKNEITNALLKISQDIAENGRPEISSLARFIGLVELAATFKNKGFSEEKEVRIIGQSYQIMGDIKYRPSESKNILIPYLEKDISLDCIKSIHIGPMSNQDLAYISMAAFVHELEEKFNIEHKDVNHKIEVIKSSIPYRG